MQKDSRFAMNITMLCIMDPWSSSIVELSRIESLPRNLLSRYREQC